MKVIRGIVNAITIIYALICFIIIIACLIGIQPTVVLSGSMEPKIPTGSLCFVDKKYPFDQLKKGDVIVYQVPRQKVIHRIVEVVDGGYKVKGDANQNVDRALITEENYYGKSIYSIPYAGYVTTSLQTREGRAGIIVFSILLVVVNYSMGAIYKKKEKQKNQSK